ncbi:hypothetical protein [Priestia endophytica]|jgi:hypothetical protein|uniref:hypothetical protein n=1 Tax=Priestia endophytica TaxID=135735 RepID=UPI00124DBC3F|nr:hypothetical protein [Priestia endophytica]KAB2488358.1 hypothetical protein F8155_24680 [Priestia endophytica]
MESNQQERLIKRLIQSKEHIMRCMLNFTKETESLKEKMEQKGMDTSTIPNTLTLNQIHKQKLEAYLIAIQLFKSNPTECYNSTDLLRYVQERVDYPFPTNAYSIEKVQEINPFIQKVRHGCYQYIQYIDHLVESENT